MLLSLLFLPLMDGKVLCFSPDTGHVSVKAPHHKTLHDESINEDDHGACDHQDCTDIPIADSLANFKLEQSFQTKTVNLVTFSNYCLLYTSPSPRDS